MRCQYCGDDTNDSAVPDDYAHECHLLFECHDIPKIVHEWYNKPWVRGNLKHRLFMRFHRRWPFRLLFYSR